MAISYNGLWKLLIDNNMKKGDLCAKTGLSSSMDILARERLRQEDTTY